MKDSGIMNGAEAENIQPEAKNFKTTLANINSLINFIGMMLFRLRKLVLAVPVGYAAVKLALYNRANLPEQVGINLQSSGAFEQMITRDIAVMGPLGLTAACLLLMFCSRKAMYPWAISVFTLAVPILILFTNLYPA
ncbi:MAG: hypothetical protein U0N82_00810 [Oscillospiraceae bacterium]|jgi:hypothetical protein